MGTKHKNLAPTQVNGDSSKTADESTGTNKPGGKRKHIELPKESAIVQIVKKPRIYVNHSYRDFSRVRPNACDSFPKDISEMSFPQKIYHILSQAEYAKCISWMPHGRAFRVHSPVLFEKKVAFQYLGHTRYSSFLRQLSNHRFKQITRGRDRNAYYHECLLRGLPHLCKCIPPPLKNASRLIPDPENEPNFYEIVKLHPLPEDKVSGEKVTEGKQIGDSKASSPVKKAENTVRRKKSKKKHHPASSEGASSVSTSTGGTKSISDSASKARLFQQNKCNDIHTQKDDIGSTNAVEKQVPELKKAVTASTAPQYETVTVNLPVVDPQNNQPTASGIILSQNPVIRPSPFEDNDANGSSKNKVSASSLVQTKPQAAANSFSSIPRIKSHESTVSIATAHLDQLLTSKLGSMKQISEQNEGTLLRNCATTTTIPDLFMSAVAQANNNTTGQDRTSKLASSMSVNQMHLNGSSAQNQSSAILVPCSVRQHQNNRVKTSPVSTKFNAQCSLSRSSDSPYITTNTPVNNWISTNTSGQPITAVNLASSSASSTPTATAKPDQSLYKYCGPVPKSATTVPTGAMQIVEVSIAPSKLPAITSQNSTLEAFMPNVVTASASSYHQSSPATNMVTSSAAEHNHKTTTVDGNAVLGALISVLLQQQQQQQRY